MSKYHSRKVHRDGLTFDSIKEYNRWKELQLLERAGEIKELKRQVKFTLIPTKREFCGEIGGNGLFKKGKVIEHACTYIADFTYISRPGQYVVEDVKGVKTDVYVIKRKLMLDKYGIRIKEV